MPASWVFWAVLKQNSLSKLVTSVTSISLTRACQLFFLLVHCRRMNYILAVISKALESMNGTQFFQRYFLICVFVLSDKYRKWCYCEKHNNNKVNDGCRVSFWSSWSRISLSLFLPLSLFIFNNGLVLETDERKFCPVVSPFMHVVVNPLKKCVA